MPSVPPSGNDVATSVFDLLPPSEADRLREALARVLLAAARVRAARQAEHGAEAAPEPPALTQRTRRPHPKRLAAWEAHWQADLDGER